MTELPEGYHFVGVQSIDAVGFNEDTREAVIWFTGTADLKVCMTCDLAGLRHAVATISDNQTRAEKLTTLRVVAGGKA